MFSKLFQNIRLVDPYTNTDQVTDILVRDGIIEKIGQIQPEENIETFDGRGLLIFPGLTDIHVHFRDPGFTYKEDIFTGAKSAAAGGFTAVACMPNTNPVIDTPELVQYVNDKSDKADCKVYPIAAVTTGQKGEQLTNFKALKTAGAVALSDDGVPVESDEVLFEALKKSKEKEMLIISHCEILEIIDGGIIHKGQVSETLGVRGMDRLSEDKDTKREIELADKAGTNIHIAHVSTKGSVEIIRKAKENGSKVTCETAPHYFSLTHEKLLSRDADFRMNPPLREEDDKQAILEGVIDGTIDCIITDHAPHSAEDKADFEKAPNGTVGLETSFAACNTYLVQPKHINYLQLFDKMSKRPKEILNLPQNPISVGQKADFAVFDPNRVWTVEPEKLHSKSKNSVFKGMELTGKVLLTVCDGKQTFALGEE